MKKVYVGMTGDLIHPGIINIIKHARQYGEVTVGLVSDEGAAKYRRLPAMPYAARKNVIEHIKGVVQVIKQDSIDYIPNLKKIKPDYVVHGDIWRSTQPLIRKQVIETIKEWDGQVIEVPYSKGYSSNNFHHYLKKVGTTKEVRQERLKRLIQSKETVRFLGAHNGLTANLVENISMRINFSVEEFDGIWLSSKTHSIIKGQSKNSPEQMIDLIHQVLDSTTKPIIVDCHNVTNQDDIKYLCKMFERFGISAMVISENNEQENVKGFSTLISNGKKAQVTDDFMIFVKINSLNSQDNLNPTIVEDTINQVKEYIQVGVDGIMVQINNQNRTIVQEFCQKYQQLKIQVPIITSSSIPNGMPESEHQTLGSKIIVYPDDLLKSVYQPMQQTAKSILINQNCNESDKMSTSIKFLNQLLQSTASSLK